MMSETWIFTPSIRFAVDLDRHFSYIGTNRSDFGQVTLLLWANVERCLEVFYLTLLLMLFVGWALETFVDLCQTAKSLLIENWNLSIVSAELTIFDRLMLASVEFKSKLNVKFVAPLGLLSMPRILLGLSKQCVELADLILVMNSSPESFESSCEQSSAGGEENEEILYLISSFKLIWLLNKW